MTTRNAQRSAPVGLAAVVLALIALIALAAGAGAGCRVLTGEVACVDDADCPADLFDACVAGTCRAVDDGPGNEGEGEPGGEGEGEGEGEGDPGGEGEGEGEGEPGSDALPGEVPLNPDDALGGAADFQQELAFACGSTSCLAVWRDFRRDPFGDIFAARIALDGSVLDETGLVVAASEGSEREPTVAATTSGAGNGFVVVFLEDIEATPRLAGRIVDDAGNVASLALTGSGTNGMGRPAIACQGDRCYVVYEALQSGDADIDGQLVENIAVDNPAAATVDLVFLDHESSDARFPDVAVSNGVPFVVFVREETALQAMPFTADSVGAGVSLALGDVVAAPDIAPQSTGFIVTWDDGTAVRTKEIDSGGDVRDNDRSFVETHGGQPAFPRAASLDDVTVVAWSVVGSFADVVGGVADALAGALTDVTIASSSEDETEPHPALIDGDTALVAFLGYGNVFDVRVARWALDDGDVSPDASRLVSAGAFRERDVVIDALPASAGGRALMVWREDGGLGVGERILGRRMDADGAFVDAAPFEIGESSGLQRAPAVASTRSDANPGWVVAWAGPDELGGIDGDVFVIFIPAAGGGPQPRRLTRTGDGGSPALAVSGGHALVVVDETASDGTGRRVPMAYVLDVTSPALPLLNELDELAFVPGPQFSATSPAVCGANSGWFVAFHDDVARAPSVLFVEAGLGVTNLDAVLGTQVVSGDQAASLACIDDTALLAWQTGDVDERDVGAALIRGVTSGTTTALALELPSNGLSSSPSASVVDGAFAVTWQRAAATGVLLEGITAAVDATTGAVDVVPLVAPSLDKGKAAVAKLAGGKRVIAYHRYDRGRGAPRAFVHVE